MADVDIAEFLTDQYDDAWALTEGRWAPGAPPRIVDGSHIRDENDNVIYCEKMEAATRADIAAKRRIVEEYHAARENWRHGAGTMGTTEEKARATERRDALTFVLQLLAAQYADRPGYKPEWAIEA